jgi:hypothetical protein
MKRYCIKTQLDRLEYFDILDENDEGYTIRLIRISDGNEKVQESFMNRHLFDMCFKTGYIYKADIEVTSVA